MQRYFSHLLSPCHHLKTQTVSDSVSNVVPIAVREVNPLESLALVEHVLADPTFPPCDHARSIALGIVLSTQITHELTRHPVAMGIATRQPEITIGEVLHRIQKDTQAGNRELLGWSWLYYRFVRVEFNIGVSVFCCHAYIDPKMLRRYEALALRHMTDLFVKQEWSVRRLNFPFLMAQFHQQQPSPHNAIAPISDIPLAL